MLARHNLVYADPTGRIDVKTTVAGSVGFLTETSAAISMRIGRFDTPWWTFSPELADYIAAPTPVESLGQQHEVYFFAGARVTARAYNAFLQGQFRDSVVELSPSQVEPIIGEAWLGVTWQISESYWLSHVAHYQSREIKDGPGSRDLLWAGLILTHNF